MADTNVGSISVDILANSGNFERGIAKATASSGQFTSAMTRMSIGNNDAKKAVNAMAIAMGAQSGVLGELVTGFLTMGPALGAAMAGLTYYNMKMKEAEEKSKATAAAMKSVMDTMKGISEVNTGSSNRWTQGILGDIAKIEKELEKLDIEKKAGRETFSNKKSEAWLKDQLKERQQGLPGMEQVAQAERGFQSRDFLAQYETAAGTTERMMRDLDNARKFADQLDVALAKIPQSGRDYDEVLEKSRQTALKILDIEDAIVANKEKAMKAQDDLIKKYKNSMEDWAKEEEEAIKKKDAYNKKLRDMLDAPRKGEKSKTETFDLGWAMDMSRTNVSSAAMQGANTKVTKVTDPALETTNKLLQEQTAIIKKLDIGTAKAVR